jgi:4a-hydroxytetrahydrobiopterin dehydratase
MTRLADLACSPCRGDVPALRLEDLDEYAIHVPDWEIVDRHHLSRTFRFPDFVSALEFVNRVGELAEHENHHPSIFLTWGKVKIDTWTHKVDGLSENDFILAAKIDKL